MATNASKNISKRIFRVVDGKNETERFGLEVDDYAIYGADSEIVAQWTGVLSKAEFGQSRASCNVARILIDETNVRAIAEAQVARYNSPDHLDDDSAICCEIIESKYDRALLCTFNLHIVSLGFDACDKFSIKCRQISRDSFAILEERAHRVNAKISALEKQNADLILNTNGTIAKLEDKIAQLSRVVDENYALYSGAPIGTFAAQLTFIRAIIRGEIKCLPILHYEEQRLNRYRFLEHAEIYGIFQTCNILPTYKNTQSIILSYAGFVVPTDDYNGAKVCGKDLEDTPGQPPNDIYERSPCGDWVKTGKTGEITRSKLSAKYLKEYDDAVAAFQEFRAKYEPK